MAETAVTLHMGEAPLAHATLAAIFALTLRVGANFANDYSGGIRGAGAVRSGLPRLIGGGKTSPGTIRYATLMTFGAGSIAGFALAALSGRWQLLLVGIAALTAAWFYTGDSHPHEYMDLGKVFVFVSFRLVTTAGTTCIRALPIPWQNWFTTCAVGSTTYALPMVNSIRDALTDADVDENTFAVRIGDKWTRRALAVPLIMSVITPLALVGDLGLWATLVAVPASLLIQRAVSPVLTGASGRGLIPALHTAGQAEFALGVTLFPAYTEAIYLH